MHPPTVFLLPRKASNDVELYGYIVPKNAQVFVNLLAISRDPNHWKNPDMFLPERFLEHEIDLKGQDFGLVPFGTGRRACPGDTLALRMLNLMLGSLLQGFNWKIGDGLKPEDLDMNDKFGITIQKAIPLRVIPISK
ncbi:cytochrome P450 76AD1-like [Chenopodium quinoa]|uniref:Cytochrome P450 76AD1-like protein n=1 Tax=Chenopodium quinoa TaxID=63459 RepID=A0A803M3B2_CHEQI|nr:cytochrome P450 76AD1-like [Chenopodium quinoa]